MHESTINILKSKGFQEAAFSQSPFMANYQTERISITLYSNEISVSLALKQGAALSGRWEYSAAFEKNIDALLLISKSL